MHKFQPIAKHGSTMASGPMMKPEVPGDCMHPTLLHSVRTRARPLGSEIPKAGGVPKGTDACAGADKGVRIGSEAEGPSRKVGTSTGCEGS